MYDEVEAMTSQGDRARRAQARRHLPRPQASARASKNTNVALDFHLRRGDVGEGVRSGAHRVFEHTLPHAAGDAHAARAVRVGRPSRPRRSLTIHTASQSPSFVRIEIARLLGWPENRVRVKVPFLGGGFGAKLYIKLEALVAVLALLVQRPVKISLTMEEQFFTLTKHAEHVPHQERRVEGRQDRRARMRGVVERRRLCRHRPARDAEVRLHRARPVRHRERRDRFVRALHQPAAGRRAARLRHPAAGVGLREPHRPDGARARHRPDRVPPQEPAARRPAAGDRHADAGRRDREGARSPRGAAWTGSKPFDRGTGTVRRGRGIAIGFKACDLADHVARHRSTSTPTAAAPSTCSTRRHGAGLRHRDGADRRRGAAHAGRVGDAWCIPTPTSRPTTWRRSARARSFTWATR